MPTTLHPRWVRVAIVALACALAFLTPAPAGAATVDGWHTTTPAKAGFHPQRLAKVARQARSYDSTCFAVVRDGRLVRDWNWGTDRTTHRQTFSVTKSITSALVGIAVRDGDLDLDDPVADYVHAWRGTASADVTVRDLMSNVSGRFWSVDSDYAQLTQARNRTAYAIGLDQEFPRGTVWSYNNAAIQVLDKVLRTATGTRTDRFAATRLFEPLGMTHTFMTRDVADRSTNVYFGVESTCLDLARFARLYLQQGSVGGHRILARSYVHASVGESSSTLNAAYGLLWWVNRYGALRGPIDDVDEDGQPVTPVTGRLVPGAAGNLFSAIGLRGQIAMVDPGSRTIVVRLGPGTTDGYGPRKAARAVTWALKR
ncbi:serine hydrolase domain-containing protein [Nocardioides mangrovi]|uniref:Beta-lactamase family protein n=1 Tax=Nocardioides mangrovi TaxID=2874580 RepID=A0ABS7UK67_9ACTN|nr:serine hydrolase domain-containing protein [Nocardioides mangrovi]MBZ5741170.1 beta-lactamase family protein [Nocardioides mangrovi]